MRSSVLGGEGTSKDTFLPRKLRRFHGLLLGGYGLLQNTSDSRVHLPAERMVSRAKPVRWVARYILGLGVLTAGLVAV